MKFQTKINETILAAEITPANSYMFEEELNTGLSIIWNTGKRASFMIDNELITINKDCVLFLSEFYNIDSFQYENLNVLQFNRQFYCVENNDELGCRGLLFYGGSEIPKIALTKNDLSKFKQIWELFMEEINSDYPFKLEMLKSLLSRLLILSVRSYKIQNHNLPSDNISVGLIREYNYLVEKNYKKYSKVSDYAKLLHKSPKTLSNIFNKYIDKTPLQIINERRILEAKRLLKYSDLSIQEISDELNFKDPQSFSHFFQARVKSAPSEYRKKITGGTNLTSTD